MRRLEFQVRGEKKFIQNPLCLIALFFESAGMMGGREVSSALANLDAIRLRMQSIGNKSGHLTK
jgi:hypothetical protein